jgi:3-oxoacyl-[acyl-carrier protein] reductase
MNLELKGKVALVTASSKGIGKAVAEAFVREGVKVAISSRNKENLISTVEDIKFRYGIEPYWCVCDLNDPKDIENSYNSIKNSLGGIDILVNNCGGPVSGIFLQLSEKDWIDAFNQVLLSVIRFSRLVIPDMMKNEGGRVINITSISVKQPLDNLMLSNSLRSSVVGFAKTLSNEVGKFNVTVNNIAPGYTLTNRLYDLAVERSRQRGVSHEDILAEMTKEVPIGRLAKPEEIASAVLFLASNMASYITGNTIQVDGGLIKSLL